MGNFFILTKNRFSIGRVALRDLPDSPLHLRPSIFGNKKKRSAFHLDVNKLDEVDSPKPRMSDRGFTKYSDFTGLKDESKDLIGIADFAGLKNESNIFADIGAESKNRLAPMDPISVLDCASDNDCGSNSLRRNSSNGTSIDFLESVRKAPVKVEQVSLPGPKHHSKFF